MKHVFIVGSVTGIVTTFMCCNLLHLPSIISRSLRIRRPPFHIIFLFLHISCPATEEGEVGRVIRKFQIYPLVENSGGRAMQRHETCQQFWGVLLGHGVQKKFGISSCIETGKVGKTISFSPIYSPWNFEKLRVLLSSRYYVTVKMFPGFQDWLISLPYHLYPFIV